MVDPFSHVVLILHLGSGGGGIPLYGLYRHVRPRGYGFL